MNAGVTGAFPYVGTLRRFILLLLERFVYFEEALRFADAGVAQYARFRVGELHACLLSPPIVFHGRYHRGEEVESC